LLITTNKHTFLYLGGFDDSRDIATLIFGFSKYLQKREQLFSVKLVGAEKTELEYFNKIIQKEQLSNYIQLIPKIPFNQIHYYLKKSSFGIVPHKKNLHTDTTIPHKLFQYMNCGMPVIVSNCNPLVRIVKSVNCGFIYTSGSAGSFCSCITKALNHPLNMRKKMGLRGKCAIAKLYNWSTCEKKLLFTYFQLLGKN